MFFTCVQQLLYYIFVPQNILIWLTYCVPQIKWTAVPNITHVYIQYYYWRFHGATESTGHCLFFYEIKITADDVASVIKCLILALYSYNAPETATIFNTIPLFPLPGNYLYLLLGIRLRKNVFLKMNMLCLFTVTACFCYFRVTYISCANYRVFVCVR